MRLAEGSVFRIDLEGGLVGVRVARRPELGMAEGAAAAEELSSALEKIATRADVRGAIMEIREAPAVAGPRTQVALGRAISGFERVRKPIALVVGASATQRLQMERIVREHAPSFGSVSDSVEQAHASVAERLKGSLRPRD